MRLTAGTRYFFLSIVGISDFSAFSQMTGIRSGYFWRIRSASALRLSVCQRVYNANHHSLSLEGGTENLMLGSPIDAWRDTRHCSGLIQPGIARGQCYDVPLCHSLRPFA